MFPPKFQNVLLLLITSAGSAQTQTFCPPTPLLRAFWTVEVLSYSLASDSCQTISPSAQH